MLKSTTPEQHWMLHTYWPSDCCLCSHEQRLQEALARVEQLTNDLDSKQQTVNTLFREAQLAKAQVERLEEARIRTPCSFMGIPEEKMDARCGDWRCWRCSALEGK